MTPRIVKTFALHPGQSSRRPSPSPNQGAGARKTGTTTTTTRDGTIMVLHEGVAFTTCSQREAKFYTGTATSFTSHLVLD
ncbi:hypothetical protein E2C01_068010 [Portunus trituberculatus]|uniref:Uncharacterized protein n=1 Tax=Portunus trituberculatus TaxID=210409 RepID=A0A5B7HV64_PORTR|nr:hypothetical protein [Portunus trituberculatus]